jgi:branched-chain amino acid transport system substrate-binding protein
VKVDAETNHTHLWPRIAKVNAAGEYEIVQDQLTRVPPDPFMLNVRRDIVLTTAGEIET